ncbi:hypothetical protein [Candidatus Albibeggiatoa sp. nov. BB20]|uniref:hypothetical protein n=1 Tax=Candidatus Albibeggiatoa sp. nov. BB20 TaxID=3162723 RepID=UPI00336586FF
MLEQELVKIGGTKLLGGTLLSIGGVSALAIGGVIAWKMWNKDTSKTSTTDTPVPKTTQSTESLAEQQCTGDESAQTLQAELQAEINALNAEKQQLSEQVDELKTKNSKTQSTTIPPVIEKHNDDSFPKTNLKLGMLQQLIRENLDFRNATT